jgi:hypothetical protein
LAALQADAKGSLPKRMANGPQADVMLKEIEGVRKALRNPIFRTTSTNEAEENDAAHE